MIKVYPKLEGPTQRDFQRAIDELCSNFPPNHVFTDAQRQAISKRAREHFMARQTKH